jgi:hypothetical protein
MVFSDTSTKLGLIQDCEQLVFDNYGDISGNSNRLYDFTARLNRAYDKLATRIMGVDGRWQFDDTNYNDFPVGSTNLISGQQDYLMDVEFMDVVKVSILDSAGNKKVLTPFDITDPIAIPYLQQPSTVGGIPNWYDKTGGSLLLYPTPNYNATAGLTVHYRRPPSYFTYTDTTKLVGVPAIFHRYLSLEASLDYAVSKQLTFKNDLATRLKEMEAQIDEWYSKRSKDEQKIIRGVQRSSR